MKGSWDSTNTILIFFCFLFSFVFNFRDVNAVPTKHLCRPEQRDALLEFKNELEIQKPCENPKTESWAKNTNCCYWKGITCDAKSGDVIELDLSHNCINGQFHSNNSLFRLQNLRFLTSLDLSFNNLSGNFLIALLNLTKLSYLSLSRNKFTGTLHPNITSLSNLEFFDASENYFVGTIPSSLFTIPSLSSISLRDNQLNGTLEFMNISSPSKLQYLDLGYNNLRGPIPRSLSKLVNLLRVDLSNLNTQGPVDFDIFSHLNSLEDLYLSYLNTTTTIDLNAILSCSKWLWSLDLSGNHVSTTSKSSITKPTSKLVYLKLSGCGITKFPEFIRAQQRISLLSLSNNMIKGQVPSWLWSFPNLISVDLSNNSFNGFDKLTKKFRKGTFFLITVLDLSSNDFQGPFFVPPRDIEIMIASKNNFSGEIPKSLCGMTLLQVLDFSNNNLNGSIPQCLENLIENMLSLLSLRDNHLSGRLPEIFTNGSHLTSLNFGHNNFVGKLPRSLKGCPLLEVLNVEHNRFNDTFPLWLQPLKKLQVLILRSNELHGSLHHPYISSGFLQLRILDVSHNNFMGALPSDFFMYWVAMFSKGDKGWDYIGEDTEYKWYYRYYKDSLALMNKGVEAKMERVLTLLTTIDFSGNKLRGKIPESIGVLKGLIVLNLSNNHFEGHIPSTMANLTELQSLDLSRNILSGKIPPQLGKLTFVEVMDFSHNKLVGMIPGSTQFQTQNPSCFQDNIGLCGPPLAECGVVHEPPPSQEEEEEEEEVEEEEEEVFSSLAAAMGVGPGIVFGLTIGYVMMSYKPHWFFKLFELISSFLRSATKKP